MPSNGHIPTTGTSAGRRAVVLALTVAYLAFVGYFTLGPVPWPTAANEAENGVLSPATWADTVTWTSGSPVEFVANIVMFIPVGLLLRGSFPRVPLLLVIATTLALTVSIEVAQIPLERVSDPRDLVANTVGGAIGALFSNQLLRRPTASSSRPTLASQT